MNRSLLIRSDSTDLFLGSFSNVIHQISRLCRVTLRNRDVSVHELAP